MFRGARWRILARNAGVVTSPDGRLPSIAHASGLIVIGWFVNSIAWLRLGDAYRAYAFAEDARGSFPASLGTVLAERVVDMSIVLVVLVVSVFLLSTTSDSSASRFLLIAAFILAAGLAGLLALMKRFGVGLARFLPSRLEAAYHRFHQGTLGSLRRLPLVLTLGLAGWLLEAARLFLVVQALGLSVPLALVPIVALGHAILSTVPTPGGVGGGGAGRDRSAAPGAWAQRCGLGRTRRQIDHVPEHHRLRRARLCRQTDRPQPPRPSPHGRRCLRPRRRDRLTGGAQPLPQEQIVAPLVQIRQWI